MKCSDTCVVIRRCTSNEIPLHSYFYGNKKRNYGRSIERKKKKQNKENTNRQRKKEKKKERSERIKEKERKIVVLSTQPMSICFVCISPRREKRNVFIKNNSTNNTS